MRTSKYMELLIDKFRVDEAWAKWFEANLSGKKPSDVVKITSSAVKKGDLSLDTALETMIIIGSVWTAQRMKEQMLIDMIIHHGHHHP